jgi:DNA-binding NarL/FixJ family response regulator
MTAKQQRICDLITLGKHTKEIAFEVGISTRTVEDHRLEIFKKVGVRNAVELTLKMRGHHELLGSRTDGF